MKAQPRIHIRVRHHALWYLQAVRSCPRFAHALLDLLVYVQKELDDGVVVACVQGFVGCFALFDDECGGFGLGEVFLGVDAEGVVVAWIGAAWEGISQRRGLLDSNE